jgi:nicotinate-nucleotide pyrophosphorylase (carboxylating)
MEWESFDWLLDKALQEDAASEDATTQALVPPERRATARLVAREAGIVAGLPLAERLLARMDADIRFESFVADGDAVGPGIQVARLAGLAGSILSVERVMLNFLQQLSGMATLAARYAERVEGTEARIYDTRKTVPGWRELAKYAVRCGGACNHRMHLAGAVLIKDNHLALMGEGGVSEAVRRAREAHPDLTVEVEVETFAQLEEALAAAPDIILLDNMTPEQVREAARMAGESAVEPPQLEASGGIDLSNVRAYAETGAERISIGALTHSAPALDLALEITPG